MKYDCFYVKVLSDFMMRSSIGLGAILLLVSNKKFVMVYCR